MYTIASNAVFLLAAATSLVLTAVSVPIVGRVAAWLGCVAQPKKDRWHTRPTPTLGGLAFFAGFLPPVLLLSPDPLSALPFFVVIALMFIVGIYDDLRRINPATKLIGQIISA